MEKLINKRRGSYASKVRAARLLGITIEEYFDKLNNGYRFCNICRVWEPAKCFPVEAGPRHKYHNAYACMASQDERRERRKTRVS